MHHIYGLRMRRPSVGWIDQAHPMSSGPEVGPERDVVTELGGYHAPIELELYPLERRATNIVNTPAPARYDRR